MTEASVFYEAASAGLGSDFLDDLQRVVDTLPEHPELGRAVGQGLRQVLLHRSPSASSIRQRKTQSSWSRLRINGDAPITGKTGLNHRLVGELVQKKSVFSSRALNAIRLS